MRSITGLVITNYKWIWYEAFECNAQGLMMVSIGEAAQQTALETMSRLAAR